MADSLRTQLAESLANAYTIERELGGGGMSRVFLAEELELGRTVVVKVLAPELAEGLSAERFAREIRLAAALQQANIVPLLRTGTNPLPYYTMPFVEGQSLRARLEQVGKLDEGQVISILRDVARALSYAHAHGVIHRDIKPDNVLLSGGTAVVTDFGIAKAIEAARTEGQPANALTGTGVSVGTPAYMAPEQIAGDRAADQRADIYSVGTLAYELLSGHTPFHDRTPQKMLAAHILDAPPPLTGVQPALNALVMRCLAKEPAQRPQSADDLLASLDALTTSSPASRRRGRNRIAIGTAVLALAALTLALRAYLTRPAAPIALGSTQQLTTTSGLEVDASISPDGRFVAYVGLAGGVERVMTQPVSGQNGTHPTIVAPSVDGRQRWPRWSADGSTLLFSSETRVYEAPAFGGTPRLLFDAGADVIRPNPTPVYSPDGKSVLYNTAEGIKLIGRDGGAPRMIVPGVELHSAEWSPDGERIAYVVGNRQWVNATGTLAPSAVWVTRVRDPKPVQVSDASHTNVSPIWLSNDELLFVSNAGGTRDIYQVQLDGSGRARNAPKRITTGLEPYSISWSAQAHRLAYSVLRSRFNIWGGSLRTTGETPIDDMHEITHENYRVEGIALSADGRSLAFDANRHGNSDIFRMSSDSGEATQLTRDSSDKFQPAWSHDGQRLAFYTTRSGTRDVYVMDADGRNVEPVSTTASEERAPTWSPDDKQVAYLSGGQGMTEQNVFISTRQGNGTWSPGRQVTKKGAVFPRWSPDGKYISYSRAGDAFLTSPTDGGERLVARRAEGSPFAFATWARDMKALYVGRAVNGGEWIYSRVPLDGSAEQLLLRTGARKGRSSNATFATDGLKIYLTLGGDEGDVWTADVKGP